MIDRFSEIEINDLIGDAVNNALARRHETFSVISPEEENNVVGGALSSGVIHGVIINPNPPCTHGSIIKHPFIYGVIIEPRCIHGSIINS